ncbi:zinc finger protein 106 isoform X1 [Oncorhynchus mykiss]|uniref:Zinc finger protein 106a n=2 Tax=Oncorhynchus mykiss TaxID=8022 RepID=A0A8C7W3E5_ONCMY|nr:zinc finger protein 106 isoform X1 [Oncorhynchus mykiss]XP_036818985.1 zinc finger protein 106 isoform X1 [Oncorhynchus mykiss]XP_036818986.1 zinc finger protein 106 isoform X1 [Oncorhynchus mykiss]XP_036818987.1 zinc finger protein 106 isoform X1 [Oncorhynchus mykiss]
MGRERKCILCQIVYSSKQEMDEHMKSMLHHRELENLKGRDCGHECPVCRVTVVSLTDYANHISSRVHKQRVETAEREGAGNDQEEEYFDKDLIKLIETRKEVIRREEEAAAKRAREEEAQRREEEESRKRQQQIQKWSDARQYFCQKGALWDWRYPNKTPPTPPPPPPRKCKGPAWQEQGGWDCSSTPAGCRGPWETQEDIRFNWYDRKQGRSATWHAQEPPNVYKWSAGQRGSGSLHSREGTNRRWQQEEYLHPPAQQQSGGREPWQQNSGGGGATGLYGSSRGGHGLPGVLADRVMTEGPSSTESLHRMDFASDQLDPVGSFDQLHRYAHFEPQDDGRKSGHQNMAQEGPAGGAEHDRKSGLGPKAFGSNPKLDKACRWSPYPSHKETHPHPQPSEKHPKGPPPPPTFQTPLGQGRDVDLRPRRDITLDLHRSSGLKPTQSRQDLRAGQQRAAQQQRSPDHSVEGREPRKLRDISTRISSSDNSNSLRTDRQTSSSSSGSTSTRRRAAKPSECLEKGLSSSSTTSLKTHLGRASSPTLNLTSSPKTHLSRASSPSPTLTSSPKTHLSRASSPTLNLTSSPKTHLSRASSPTLNLTSNPKTHLSRASSPSPSTTPRTQLSRASSQDSDQPRLSRHRSQDLGRGQGSKSPQQDQEQLLTEMLRRAKETLLDKRSSVELSAVNNRTEGQKAVSNDHRMEKKDRKMVLHIEEQQQVESSAGVTVADDNRQKRGKSSRQTRQDRASSRANPAEDRANPAEDRASSRANPAEDRASSRANPAEDRASSRANPAEDRASSRANPAEDRASSRANPAEDRASSRANPAEDRASSRANPAEDRAAATEPLETMMEFVTSPSDNHMSVQSVQVSTSTMESPEGAVLSLSPREEAVGEREEARGLVAGEEAMEVADAGLWSDSDPLRTIDPNLDLHTTSDPSSGSTQTKPTLPLGLKRDLTRHIGSKTKSGSHEPNLNIARRIRNVSGTRRGEAEKDLGLKPTLRQLISSSGSRRCVNWDQVYQEVHRKKQQQGKGMPRFGIEMVSCDQEGEDVPLAEGFQWETLFGLGDSGPAFAPVTPRKRSLSESSVAPDRSTANLSSLFGGQTPGQAMPGERAPGDGAGREVRCSSDQQSSSLFRDLQQPKVEATPCEDRAQREVQGPLPEGPPGVEPRPDSVIGDSSSGTEQTDTQGARMKRRAAGDIACPEIPHSERKNKRMKVKSKKERLQVDHLLAVSLREEDLSRSLQGVDNSLIQARAALQAAYMEVQRLLVVKQQVSMEMSTLRRKRIELLQGIQGGVESLSLPRVKSCEEEMPLEMPPSLLSPLTEPPVASPNQVPLYLPPCSTPPSLSPSHQTHPQPITQSVVIKQEPLSPGGVTTKTEDAESAVTVHHGSHSTTSEPTPIPTAPHADCAASFQPVRGRKSERHRVSRELSQEGSSLPVGACAEWKDPSAGSPGLVQSGERGVQVSTEDRGNFKPHPAPLSGSSSRKSSRSGVQDLETSPVLPLSLAPSNVPPQAEVKTIKRVRKLKKKRVLRKAKGEEQQLDNSDTELEAETTISRPVRLLGTRRKPNGGSRPQVITSSSTSSPPGTSEDRGERPGPPGSPATRPEERQEDSDSSLEMVVLPQAAPGEVVTIDTSGPEDGDVDICPRPQPAVSPPAPDTLKTEPQKLACNEVTSTSEMDGSSVGKSEVQLPPTSVKLSKTSSDLSLDGSSEPGGEDLPSEGMFEGHQETVNAMQVHMGLLYTCSGDRTVRAFSLVSRECVAVFEGHSTKVNCLLVSSGPGLQQRLYSGSSDQTIRCYNLRSRECVDQFSLPDRVLCLHNRWKVLYAGLANGSVVTFSIKTNKQLDVFECHGPRAVSCLATAQEGARRILLVGSYDSTISIRDAKSGLLLRTLEGHTKTVLCMKVVNDLVFSGSSDQSVHAHNIHTGELVRIYKGHSHAVTVVAILGKVMVTACLDKLVRVYELQSHDRLQVYGGHTDMVMCMAIHKNMIYTGCYDGSVQAVKLNLIQNYHCRWHGCSLIFGVLDHLQQHLLQDHASPNTQNLKCRWKNCDQYFTARNGSKQGAPRHMLQHVEEEWSGPAHP